MAGAGRDSGASHRRGAARSSAEHKRRFRSQLLSRKEQARRAAQNGARSPPRPPSSEFTVALGLLACLATGGGGEGLLRTHAVSEPDCPAARTLSARCARAPCAFVPAWPNLEGSHAQLAGICLLHRLPALQHSSCLMAGFSQHARISASARRELAGARGGGHCRGDGGVGHGTHTGSSWPCRRQGGAQRFQLRGAPKISL